MCQKRYNLITDLKENKKKLNEYDRQGERSDTKIRQIRIFTKISIHKYTNTRILYSQIILKLNNMEL